MAFFVIPDTPYVWRVKRCHGIQMYLRHTFLIHSGSDAIECNFILVIAVCRIFVMQTPEIRYRNVTHTPRTSQAYNFHIFAIDMQIYFWRDQPLIRNSLIRAACLLSSRVVRFKYFMLLFHIYESACQRSAYLELLIIMLQDHKRGNCAAAADDVAFSWRSKRFQIRRAFASRFVKCVIS